MNSRPSLDVHAHIDASIDPGELSSLGVVFAATRSLDEAALALARDDTSTVWGVGCHPGIVGAHAAFDPKRFATLMTKTAYVSEVGLDGKSRVPLKTQRATLDAILAEVVGSPRVTSLHSSLARDDVLDALERSPIEGAILHWWLGDERQTRRALDLGCFFSFNASSIRRTDLLALVPLDRLLTETDHPFGDRSGGNTGRPGFVAPVEEALARWYCVPAAAVRATMWANLARLVSQTGCSQLLPRMVRRELLAS